MHQKKRRKRICTAAEARSLGSRYWCALVRGRPLRVEASRSGYCVSSLRNYGRMFAKEHLSRIAQSTTLLPEQRERVQALMAKYNQFTRVK